MYASVIYVTTSKIWKYSGKKKKKVASVRLYIYVTMLVTCVLCIKV